ncbi:MAG: hypothetical protein NAOJABEB_02938 [Steroidobacteraceae bacterium]|nr:hypothetical protein [Steroidobacteraceae bacterium]
MRLYAHERLLIAQRGEADARELVGERTGGLVVIGAGLQGEGPLSQGVERSMSALADGGGAQHGARAVGEEHAQVAITALAEASEVAGLSRGTFLGCEAEPGGEVTGVPEVTDRAARGGQHRGGGQQAHARHRQQRGAGRRVTGGGAELRLEASDARFEEANLLDQQRQCLAQQRRDRAVRVGGHAADLLESEARAGCDRDPELPAEAAQGVDPRGPCRHPQRAGAMQGLQRLLLDRLDAYRHDVGTAQRLEQGRGIGRIGLVALDVGAHVARWQQLHVDAERPDLSGPEVCRATGFHHDELHGAVGEEAFALRARQSMAFDDPPVLVGHREFEDVLCQVDGDGRSMHLGLLPVGCADTHTT